jgi:hypothetical protein
MMPYENALIITPDNDDELSVGPIVGILIDHTDAKANIAIANKAGASVVLTGLATGVIHPIKTNKIFATGTTATTVTVLW